MPPSSSCHNAFGRPLRHWPSKAGMLPQSHCGDEEDRPLWTVFMILLCLYKNIYVYIYIYIYIYIYKTNFDSFLMIRMCKWSFKQFVTHKIKFFSPLPSLLPCHTLPLFSPRCLFPCHTLKSDKLWNDGDNFFLYILMYIQTMLCQRRWKMSEITILTIAYTHSYTQANVR